MKFGVWYGEVNCPAKEMKRIFEDWKLAESKWKASVALALIQDLRQNMMREKLPAAGKRWWIFRTVVSRGCFYVVACSVLCYSPSMLLQTLSKIWYTIHFVVVVFGGNKDIWKGVNVKKCNLERESHPRDKWGSRNKQKQEINYSPIRIDFKKSEWRLLA